ncbi:M48 family metallopeptidase [Candidatus Bipolaricaulota bacterium]|nr:M48 family metallopeptidase [Candidatus Bipolaricaulota bacterium]
MEKRKKLKKFGFDLEAYEKAQNYEFDSLIINIGSTIASLLVLVLFLLFGSKPLYGFLSGSLGNVWAVRAIYIVIFAVGFFLLDLPTSWLSFRLEHKYELSNQNTKSWLIDQLKSLLISLALALVGFTVLFWTIAVSDLWWVWTWIAFTVISIFIGFISPTLLMPLFYNFQTLEDEDLKKGLKELANRANLDVLGVFNMEASEKTKKAIGALTGIGSSRRIILSDTMLENYSAEEIEAVIAHEMGHHKYHDIWFLLGLQSLFSLLGFYLIARFIDPVLGYFSLGLNVSALPVILGMMEIILFTLSPLKNWLSRIRERAADGFSLNLVDNPNALGEALVKLSQQNLGNPAPPRLVEWLFYDHPSGLNRVERAMDYEG